MDNVLKVVFFDIDGTLIDPKTDFQIPESAIGAIQKLRKAGHLAVVNTGRTASFMENCILDAGFDAMIYGCGTMITYRGEELMHVSLEKNVIDRLIDLLRKCRIDGVLEGKEKCYFDYQGEIYNPEFKKLSQAAAYIRGDFEHVEAVDKLYVRKGEYSDFDRFYHEFKDELQFIDRGKGFYELVPVGYSKATGMEYLIDYLKRQELGKESGRTVSMDFTYSIGDSTNDLPMLEAAGTSIAMGNSMKEILGKVTHVTKNIEDNGIMYAIENFIL